MSKYIVDIHGEIEGDYEIVGKYEEQETIKKLEEQIKQLQNRCHALTHGLVCVFCPYECEHKAESEKEV